MPGNSRFAIAIHVLSVLGYLEAKGADLVSSNQIALSANTHAVVIRKLIRVLKEAGLVEAKEGKGGGVRLAKDPAKISLYDVYLAVEDEEILSARDNPPFKACPVSRCMKGAFGAIVKDVDAAIARSLRGKSLQSVIDRIT